MQLLGLTKSNEVIPIDFIASQIAILAGFIKP